MSLYLRKLTDEAIKNRILVYYDKYAQGIAKHHHKQLLKACFEELRKRKEVRKNAVRHRVDETPESNTGSSTD